MTYDDWKTTPPDDDVPPSSMRSDVAAYIADLTEVQLRHLLEETDESLEWNDAERAYAWTLLEEFEAVSGYYDEHEPRGTK